MVHLVGGAPPQGVVRGCLAAQVKEPGFGAEPQFELECRWRQAMHTHHAIDYIEFTVRDLAEAKGFYSTAFGWKFNDYGPEYAGIQGKTDEVGGLHQTAALRQGGPLVILYSDDLEASLSAVKSAGGRVLQEPYPFPGGRRFHFADPSGNELAVWSPA